MLKRGIVLATTAMWGFGCVQQQQQPPQPDETQEIIENLVQAGFPADDIMVVDGAVYVGRDAEVSLAASREMLQAGPSSKEQYRTSNLVSSSVTKICIDGSTFTGSFSTALDLAIQNYNELPLTFLMVRTPSTGCSATINAVIAAGVVGGSAGFPSGGMPYGTINIGSGLSSYSVDVIEHVITHELGHTIGFRHTDYYNRSISCGTGGNEGDAGVGAIHIDGTPTDATVGGSIMNSCFRSSETGELTSSDDIALAALYGQAPMQLQRWATRQGGFWSTQQWLIGDFNGDGKLEPAKAFNDGGMGSVDVHVSNGSSFAIQRWATQQGGYWDTQRWLAGDFNGDGKTDVAKAFSDGGLISIDAHISNGSSFAIQRWETQRGGFSDTQKWLAGDFNGDGKADLANVFNDGGQISIDVHVSTGSSFAIQRWATQQGGYWDTQKWLAGDFNGDGKTDLANVFSDGGLITIDVHVSTGSGFSFQRWETQQGGFWDAQKWSAGDFNGDGKADLANAFGDGGLISIDVHVSNGGGFYRQRWATQQGGYSDGQKWLAGDVNGDHIADLVDAFDDGGLGTIDVHRR
jgi:hypothetical protein